MLNPNKSGNSDNRNQQIQRTNQPNNLPIVPIHNSQNTGKSFDGAKFNVEKREVSKQTTSKDLNSEEVKSQLEIVWDNFSHFVKEAFMKTPYETLFEIALLIAGGTRTVQLFNTMGQSGFAAVIGLIYSEIGIILYEFLIYKGKRVKVKKTDKRTGRTYEVYPFINQKSLAKWGLWLVHIPLTVFFTTSDLILENLEALSGGGDMTSSFAWVLGFVIGASFLADLIILINYKEKNPSRIHEERMFELLNEKEEFEYQKEEIRLRAQIDYEKTNAKPLIELEAKFGKREEIMNKYAPKFGEKFIEDALEDVGLNFNKPQSNQNNQEEIKKINKQPQNFQKEESDEELIKKLQERIEEVKPIGNIKNNQEGAENFQKPRQ